MKHPVSQGPTQPVGYCYCFPQRPDLTHCHCVCMLVSDCVCAGVRARASADRCVDPHTQHCGYIRLAAVSLLFDPAAINTSLLLLPVFLLLLLRHINGPVPTQRWWSSVYNTHTQASPSKVYTDVQWWPSLTFALMLLTFAATAPNSLRGTELSWQIITCLWAV